VALCAATPVTKSSTAICIDAPGFDRAGFHNDFHADVVAFFRKHLIEAAKP
jgi:hypothetical protein